MYLYSPFEVKLALWCSLICLCCAAQSSQLTIKGSVSDISAEDMPIEYAIVRVLNPTKNEVVGGTVTNSAGKFTIEVGKGTYHIEISHVSFETKKIILKKIIENTNIGMVYLETLSKELDAVIIQSEKATYRTSIDKKVYEAQKDFAARGGTVNDILDNVPSVSVDADGTVALRGNQNVNILIDGKPSGLTGVAANETLQQLAAADVERVEVVTAPSARYDAEGNAGVINIILKKNTRKGTNGALTVYTGLPQYFGATGNLNHRIGKVNLFTTTGYQDRKVLGNAETITHYLEESTPISNRREKRMYDRKRRTFNTNTGLTWDISEKAALTAKVSYLLGNQGNVIENQISDNTLLQNTRITEEEVDNRVVNSSIGYVRKFEKPTQQLSFDVQLERFVNDKFFTIREVNTDINEFVGIRTLQKRQLLQGDYIHPIKDHTTLEFGYRGNFKDVTISNSVESVLTSGAKETDTVDVLSYTEDVNALYGQLQTKLKKFSFLGGLRLESTRIGIGQQASQQFTPKRYVDVFPSLTIKYKLSEEEDIAIGYSRRIQRPRLRFITPFPSRTSATSLFQGNPDLDPSYANTVELSYHNTLSKATLQSAIYYTRTQQSFTFIAERIGETDEGIPIIRRQPINLAETYRYGVETTVTYSPNSIVKCVADLNLFQQGIRGKLATENLDAESTSWLARLQTKIKLPAKINTQISISYKGPTRDGQTLRKGIFNSSIGISKAVFGTKGMLTLAVQDVLNTRKRRLQTTRADFASDVSFQRRERSAVLSFNYRFNQKKAKEKRNARSIPPDLF